MATALSLSFSTAIGAGADVQEIQNALKQYSTALEAGRYAEAEQHASRLLAIAERSNSKLHVNVLNLMADLRKQQGRFDEALAFSRQAIKLAETNQMWAAVANSESGAADYAHALQTAKRQVRREKKWASPYYWATFVLIGPG
ncbi:MAG: tetratricopeptide repeat protein [Planctomycetia bacterium]|nr:tetratricopeptide repeat protein [Planctomycetia bacterium]